MDKVDWEILYRKDEGIYFGTCGLRGQQIVNNKYYSLPIIETRENDIKCIRRGPKNIIAIYQGQWYLPIFWNTRSPCGLPPLGEVLLALQKSLFVEMGYLLLPTDVSRQIDFTWYHHPRWRIPCLLHLPDLDLTQCHVLP